MGKLVYLMNVSLDGYVETLDHSLDWSVVDEETHRWFTDRSRETDAFLYGRRLYELMNAFWPTAESLPSAPDYIIDFARVWNATPKIVFSKSLTGVEGNSRLVSGDVGDVLARLRTEFPGELSVAGPTLAAQFMRRGLIDEYRVVVHPVILGAGLPFFPALETPVGLRLTETRKFASGVMYLGYVPA